MLWSAGIDAPKHVWVHGWLLVQGGERMSKSRGNFLDPHAVVAAFGADGARYVTLREVAFDRDTEVSWDSFVRRYNADLANDFGNLVNRTVSMVNRYFGGERPEPRDGRGVAAGRGLGRHAAPVPREAGRATSSTTRWASSGSSWAAANKTVDAEQPWTLAKAGEGRATPAPRRGCGPSWATSSRPAGWWAWRWRRSCPAWRRG